ncbi:endothelin-converting enzyme 2 [Nematostella vectensis]|uniref:endothelin-converting enzyme 2 n=1 Tax=Nematostella vectensis TaxID=45351 RepID=UPI0020776FFC|nr:endothelin-converting enzyme 2 [Nematostella vectensis]XP_048580791.1 endothelin-converting enzyme 2 [Nematostella vectensis]
MSNQDSSEVTHEPLLRYDDDDSFAAFGGNTASAGDADSLEGHVITVIRPSNNNSLHRLVRKPLFWSVIAVVFLLLACVVLSVLLAKSHYKVSQQQRVCLSAGCLDAAHYMLHAVDNKSEPCNDFFQYACGGWMKNNPIPSSEAFWGTFSWLWKKNQATIKRLLTDDSIKNSTSKAVRAARTFYDACMNLDEINNRGSKPLLELIDKIGGWSLSDSWDSSKFVFAETLKRVQIQYNTPVFFNFDVDADDKDSSSNIIKLDQAGIGIERSYYLLNETSEELTAYLEYMTRVGVLLGGKDETTVRDKMREVLRLEIQLAQIFIPPDNRSQIDQLYTKITVKELISLCPKIPWMDFFSSAFSGVAVIKESESVVVMATEYLRALSAVISGANQTVLNDYMVWHVVEHFAPSLSSPFRDAHQALRQVLDGASKAEDLWARCISETDEAVGMALGKLFIKETFEGSSKTQATEMIDAIRAAFKKRLPYLDWMDEKTRLAAIDKADAVVDMIGYPSFIESDAELDSRYKELAEEFTEVEYFANQLAEVKFSYKKNIGELRKPVDKNKWLMTPQTVNAYYSPSRNQIVFPAGILQAPYFDKRSPKFVNYGSIGAAVGHELVHGFDNSGRMYDKRGNYGTPWWTQKAVDGFKVKADCLIKQYNQFNYYGKNDNGKYTLGENIADNGGLKASYAAYQDWVQKHGEENTLPVIGSEWGLTNDQLFFIAYGQSWCASIRPEKAIAMLDTDPHSPNKFRVLGTLSNLKEFARAWKCPLGSPMNPVKKCVIW